MAGLRILLILAFGFVPFATAMAPSPAFAQGFFERLFGPRVRFPHPGEAYPPPPGEIPGRRPAPSGEPPAPRIEILPKDPDARRLLVVGDFLARNLAAGLDEAFAEETKLQIVERSNGSSGIVRDDFYNWVVELPKILEEEQPGFVVVLVGTNDRQQMRLPGGARAEVRSPQWDEAYRARVGRIAAILKDYGRPYYWVSAPPLRGNQPFAHTAHINTIFKSEVETALGQFIDVWDGFTDENDRYTDSGPDIDGQNRTLRAADGINFTRAGRRKLAFYVEREILRQSGLGGGLASLLASTGPGEQVEIGPDGKRRIVGPILPLTGPAFGQAGELAGAPGADSQPAVGSPIHSLVVAGGGIAAAPGRVDDFRWPRESREAAPAVAEAVEEEDAAEETEAAPVSAAMDPAAPPVPRLRPRVR